MPIIGQALEETAYNSFVSKNDILHEPLMIITILSLIYHSPSHSTQLRSDEDHTMAKNMHTLTLMSISIM